MNGLLEESKRLKKSGGYSTSHHVIINNTACFEALREDSCCSWTSETRREISTCNFRTLY